MLWVRPSFQSEVIPSIMSNTQNYVTEYEYTGTRDYTAWAALNATFNFRTWLGEDNITSYIKNLADEGTHMASDLSREARWCFCPWSSIHVLLCLCAFQVHRISLICGAPITPSHWR
jgi:hypothetical protein